jgi:hypothetical protein
MERYNIKKPSKVEYELGMIMERRSMNILSRMGD